MRLGARTLWLVLNRQYSENWPNITAMKQEPKEADTYRDENGKFEKYFSAEPGDSDMDTMGAGGAAGAGDVATAVADERQDP